MFLLFILCLIPIIVLHEMAHLIAAKCVGCGVEVFSIGFGKPIFRKEFGDTMYQITPWLFGGYCKVEGETVKSDSPRAFTNLRYRDKLIMITAGCLINIIMGLIALNLYRFGIYNFNIYFFGYLSFWLGIINLLPIPALDGSYPILVGLEKIYGKEVGYRKMNKIVSVGFAILMTLNIISLGILIIIYRQYLLKLFIGAICFILKWITKLIALTAISG